MAKVAREHFVVQYVKSIRKLDPGIGGVKLWYMYYNKFRYEKPIGRDKFMTIIDNNGLKIRLKIRKPRTTDSSHGLPVYPNLVRDYIPFAPNRLWVSDITYITIWDDEYRYSFCYLSLVLDAYTEEIVGWSIGDSLTTIYPLEALKMALKRINGQKGIQLIHHSDRGSQYASKEYIGLLKENHIQISMTENGDPKENAQAERINNTMKNELLKDMKFYNINDVKLAVQNAVDFYNNERPHMSINMMAPSEAANCTGELIKKWKSYRIAAIKNKIDTLDIPNKSLPLLSYNGLPSGLYPPVNPL